MLSVNTWGSPRAVLLSRDAHLDLSDVFSSIYFKSQPIPTNTACSPTLQNVRGTVGHPVPGTELRVVQPDTLEPLPTGEQGLVLARGPGVCEHE